MLTHRLLTSPRNIKGVDDKSNPPYSQPKLHLKS
ncbi:hypothetical protein CYCME_0950 [Cycloclasticus zancles 78-ME]|uniref:Uncharacterized protein n=1 Tax=Cycloclasticus zancles 78-ME TaxID=1198232 RepID=S5TWC8_9GAMM|nr:hypothetical protein CYCME_0950 [Cycloclasticus zancles 78-ME]